MQNCREVSYLMTSDGLEHVGWPTRLLTRLHLLFCWRCRQYAREVATIGRIGRETLSADSVSRETVQRLEGSILRYITREHNDGREEMSGDASDPTRS